MNNEPLHSECDIVYHHKFYHIAYMAVPIIICHETPSNKQLQLLLFVNLRVLNLVYYILDFASYSTFFPYHYLSKS